VPRDSAGKLMRRPFGAAAALVLAIVVSLFGTSLSVGRQPTPVAEFDPSAFTVIVPPETTETTEVAAVAPTITDFRNEAALVSRVTPELVQPRHRFVRKGVRASASARRVSGPVAAVGSGHKVRGIATWYCLPGVSTCTSGHRGGMYAAAGSELRIGNWRGRHVKVCGNGNCIVVTLIDWCACGGSRIIDLYHDAFSRLASPSSGGLGVTVSW
jgi:rare lipoprotein A (peptidoglycan hydrolase)